MRLKLNVWKSEEKNQNVDLNDYKLNGKFYCTHPGCDKSSEKRYKGYKTSGWLTKHFKDKHANVMGPLPVKNLADSFIEDFEQSQSSSIPSLNECQAQNEINIATNNQNTQQQSQNVLVSVNNSIDNSVIIEIIENLMAKKFQQLELKLSYVLDIITEINNDNRLTKDAYMRVADELLVMKRFIKSGIFKQIED